MEQCIKLGKELEQAIKQGYLKEFIDCGADKRREFKRRNGRDHKNRKHTR